ncbi:MAG TPA: M55 family metallopeptidase [Chloroflexota bacterium]|nr:M55 family metallopeptidase [Chloroflexota bacterium]
MAKKHGNHRNHRRRPLKIFVITDLEGAAMVFTFGQTRDNARPHPAVEEAMRILTREVNACVDGILDADPKADVLVLDGHGSGGILYELVHDGARYARGVPHPWGLDETYDALFFVGQHAMAGTPEAPLAHTFSSKTIEYHKLNGSPVGEFGTHAYMAGTRFDVPVAFLSGDDKAVLEARALVPNIVGVATKQGTGPEGAVSLSPAEARRRIRAGAKEACQRVSKRAIDPLRLEPPYEWEVRYLEGHEARLEGFLRRPGTQRIDSRTAVLRGADVLDVFGP